MIPSWRGNRTIPRQLRVEPYHKLRRKRISRDRRECFLVNDHLHGRPTPRLGGATSAGRLRDGALSLAYLKQFPVEVLKIDRTFIEGLGQDSGDRAITAAIERGSMLGLSTVAEGVERPDQAAELTALGCDLAQGFDFARPMYACQSWPCCCRTGSRSRRPTASPTFELGIPALDEALHAFLGIVGAHVHLLGERFVVERAGAV